MAGASDGRCVKCCEYNLIAAFHNFYMTHGSCVFCLTADFAVQQAKKLNVHGCDLKLSYGKSYCTHTMEAKGNGCSGWQADHQGGDFWNQNDLFLSQNDCESKRSFFDMASEIRRKFANLFQICRLRSNLKSPSQVCDSRSHL
jgi:hypothetical protein